MLRIRLLFLIVFLIPFFTNSQNKYNYVGGVKLNDSLVIPYKINFVESGGVVKGYSITDLGGAHETRSNIFGEYDLTTETLNFREIGIVYTKSPVSQNDFCFLNTTFKKFIFGKSTKVKANFIGLFSDGTQCVNGEILLNTQEKAEKRLNKVVDKINKSKKIPDSLKQSLSQVNLMDALKMNVLKKDQTLSVFTKSKSIKLIIYDGGKLDGDKISITVNGKTILHQFKVEKLKKVIAMDLPEKRTSVVIKANNEGEISPNTVIVELDDGINTIKALSNLKKDETTQIDILK